MSASVTNRISISEFTDRPCKITVEWGAEFNLFPEDWMKLIEMSIHHFASIDSDIRRSAKKALRDPKSSLFIYVTTSHWSKYEFARSRRPRRSDIVAVFKWPSSIDDYFRELRQFARSINFQVPTVYEFEQVDE